MMKKNLFLILVILMVSCKAQQGSTPAVSTSPVSIFAIEWKLKKMGDRD